MKYSVTAAFASLATLSNAYLTYNSQTHAISCPIAAGSYCLAPGSPVIVNCANSVGTLATCATGQTCYQTGPDAGNAKCSTTPSNSTGTPIYDAAAAECNCASSSAHPVIPPTSSMGPSNLSSTSVRPIVVSTTPVSPAKVSTTSVSSHGGSSGMPQSTTRVTTLNPSWKPTLASTSSTVPTSTIVAPVQQTRNAAVGNGANTIAALGAAGLLAMLL